MIDLYARIGNDAALSELPTIGSYFQQCRRENVAMLVGGDEPVDSMFFEDSQFSLICRADLLVPKQKAVAAYLAKLYMSAGDEFVSGLQGTFAVIIHDHRTRTLKAWTDHFGVQQLVFTESGRILVVATDTRLLLASSSHSHQIDAAAIREYLQYTCIPGPRTIYKGISKLAAGHQLTSHPRPHTRAYWDMSYQEQCNSHRTEEEWADATRDAVRSAVAENVKNVDRWDTLGCFLSGGTDSSSVAGFVGQITENPPRTFSIGFNDPGYNEIDYARIAAKRFNADHHEYFVRPNDVVDLIHKAAQAYDEPFGNSSIVPTYYCAQLAREYGITHILAGDGGDELFGGNARYVHDRVFQRYSALPLWARRKLIDPAVEAASNWTNLPSVHRAASYIRRSNLPVPDRYYSYCLISSLPGHDLFTRDFLATANGHNPIAPARNHFLAGRAQTDLNRWLYLDLKITITDNDLRKVTTMSRLAGVTPRYPLLNHRLAEFTGTIPPELKVRRSHLRYIFKKAMKTILPNEIITKSKHGFGMPYSVWLGEYRPLRDLTFDVLGSPQCTQRGYFRAGLLDWLWSKYESVHRGYYGEILWMLLMLELWHSTRADDRVAKQRTPISVMPQFT